MSRQHSAPRPRWIRNSLWALAWLAALPAALAQVPGTYVGQTERGDTVMIQVDADGDQLVWSFGELAFQAVCPDGSARSMDYFFPVFAPIAGQSTRASLRTDFFAENMTAQFAPDGQTVSGRVRAAVPVLMSKKRAEVCDAPWQTYSASLQSLRAAKERPTFGERRQAVPATAVRRAERVSGTLSFSGLTSQGYPISIELGLDSQGRPAGPAFFYPTAWDTTCDRGGVKSEGGAFIVNLTPQADGTRFKLDDSQNLLRGELQLLEGGTRLEGRFTLISSLFADAETSLHKAAACTTGELGFQAAVAEKTVPR